MALSLQKITLGSLLLTKAYAPYTRPRYRSHSMTQHTQTSHNSTTQCYQGCTHASRAAPRIMLPLMDLLGPAGTRPLLVTVARGAARYCGTCCCARGKAGCRAGWGGCWGAGAAGVGSCSGSGSGVGLGVGLRLGSGSELGLGLEPRVAVGVGGGFGGGTTSGVGVPLTSSPSL